MEPKIVRKAESGACKWCRALEGTYLYKDVKSTGSDVYRRHEFCRCIVTYENGKKRQDVWSKTEWQVEEEKAVKERIKKIVTKDQIEEKIRNVKNTADFYVGLNGQTLLGKYADWIGTNKMRDYLNSLESQTAKRIIITDYRKTSFIGDGGTVDIRKFEKTTGLNCGRNGNNHKQKINDLINQTKKALLKDLPQNDRFFLENYLKRLMEVKD